MNVEYINPFISATINVFQTMFGVQLVRKNIFTKNASTPEFEISAIIGLTGRAQGTVVLSLNENAAKAIAEGMLGEPQDRISAEVMDSVGEITNMVAGAAKAQLAKFEMSLTIPSVVLGKGYYVNFPSKARPIGILFESPWGPLTIEVGFVEEASAVKLEPACA